MVIKTKEMSILDHILEIRTRLMWAAGSVLILTIGAFFFADQLFDLLTFPAGNLDFIYTEVPSMMTVYMKVCLTAGVIVSMPVLVYHFVMFVAPGLEKKEKRYVYIIIPWIFLMFLAGIAFGYFIFLPNAIEFLTTSFNDIAEPYITIDSYISFLTRMLLALGLIFEMPILLTFLARLGIISWRWLLSKWKIAVIGCFVLAAIVTPTPDPLNMTIVALPIIALYGMSIWLAWLVQKRKPDDVVNNE